MNELIMQIVLDFPLIKIRIFVFLYDNFQICILINIVLDDNYLLIIDCTFYVSLYIEVMSGNTSL